MIALIKKYWIWLLLIVVIWFIFFKKKRITHRRRRHSKVVYRRARAINRSRSGRRKPPGKFKTWSAWSASMRRRRKK